MKLSGNTIFITGGTSGIGLGLAEEFHRRGNQVIIGGRRKSLLDTITKAYAGMGAVEIDIGDPEQISDTAGKLIRQYPALNVLINNAGMMPFDDAAGCGR